VIFRAGPGIRFWAAPWIAVGYTTQLSLRSISGPLLAVSPSSTLSLPTDEFSDDAIEMVGRFSVLAVF
jgi:hypothetical protein